MRSVTRRRVRRDDGFSMIFMALVLVVLLTVSALVVDLGAWQVEASNAQQAADAAALAGVVRLPDGDAAAIDRAREVAADNGFVHDPAGTGVTVDVIPRGDETLEVTITQPNVDQYFSQVVRDPTTITRTSTSQYVQPVPLGSPRNFLGTNDLLAGIESDTWVENFSLAVSNDCTRREYGDRIAPAYNAWDIDDTCSSTPRLENPEYNEHGYVFGVRVPEGLGTVDIQMFDAPTCPGSTAGDENFTPFDTTITVRDDDTLDPYNGTALAQEVLEGGYQGDGNCVNGPSDNCDPGLGDDAHLRNCWATLHKVHESGTYYLQVDPIPVDADTRHNNFALRARVGGTFAPCTSDETDEDNYEVGVPCPDVFGIEHLPVFANIGGTASFFLADVDTRHNNKTMQVTLYDPAEGADTIKIIDPNLDEQTFTWEVLCSDESRNVGGSCPQGDSTPPDGWTGGPTSVLNVSGEHASYKTFPGNDQTGKYSDRLVRLSFQLPENIADEYDGRTWWRIEYFRPGSGNDRTTWSVKLIGNPVRLLPNQATTTTTAPTGP